MKFFLGLVIGGVLLLSSANAQTTASRTHVPLDTWLETAIRFVQWPSELTGAPLDVLTLCHPTGELKQSRLGGHKIGTRRLVLMPVGSPQETGPCHAFYSGSRDSGSLEGWMAAFHHRSVLTLGAGAEFCAIGATICPALSTRPDSHFAVNYRAAQRLGLRVSSHLPAHDVSLFGRSGRGV
jgi:hypothetical protein